MHTAPKGMQENTLVIGDLRDLWLFVLRRARTILAVAVCVFLASTALAFVLSPRYAGEALIMLDARRTKVSNVETVVSDLQPDAFAVRSEMDVLESRAVIDRVIDALSLLDNPVFNRRLDDQSWLGSLLGKDGLVDPERQKRLDRSAIADTLRRNLEISNDGRSYTMTVRYKDKDPMMAMKIANAFADQYLLEQMDVKLETTQLAGGWLGRRIEELRNEVRQAEQAVEEFKRENDLLGVGNETVTQQQLAAITPKLLEALAERSRAKARLNEVTGKDLEKVESSGAVLSSPLIQKLREQEAEVLRKQADLGSKYGEKHPAIINTQNELAGIRAKIREEVAKLIEGIQNEYNIASSNVQALQAELDRLEGKTGKGNQAMVTLRQLEREAASSRKLYEDILARSKQVSSQSDLQLPDARVVAHAEVPLKPYFPRPFLFALFGLFAGTALGFVVAFLQEHLDRGFRATAQIEKAFHIAGLGLVPMAEPAGPGSSLDYLLEKPLSSYTEAYRSVLTAVHFSNIDKPAKVVVVTSSVPGEGKTVFVASLARVLAMSGKRVLLIDGDLRRSSVCSVLGLDADKPDLAMLLAHDATLEETLQKDKSGADVIIAHSKTPNPQEILGSRQMEHLLADLRDRYDMIIIDTPPVIAVTDVALVGKFADTALYIVKWASTPREVVGEGLRQLQTCSVKISGVVLTQVDMAKQQKYGYGDFGYYYGKYKDYYFN